MPGIVARINQGRYDTEKELLVLLKNSVARNRIDVLDAVQQRMKIVCPKIYQRKIGPIHLRNRDKRFKCYRNNPKSLELIAEDILNDSVPYDSLSCDDCWGEDLSAAWGYYGWATKMIPRATWAALCESRADVKFVE